MRFTDHPPSTLRGDKLGIRARAETSFARGIIRDQPVPRHSITKLLAPAQAEQTRTSGAASPGERTASRRRIGRDTPAPIVTTTADRPAPLASPASAQHVEANPRVSSVAELGAVVRARRIALGFNQQRLADVAGTGRRFVSELESGKPTLEFNRVLQCCEALGIDLFARARR